MVGERSGANQCFQVIIKCTQIERDANILSRDVDNRQDYLKRADQNWGFKMIGELGRRGADFSKALTSALADTLCPPHAHSVPLAC